MSVYSYTAAMKDRITDCVCIGRCLIYIKQQEKRNESEILSPLSPKL